MRNAIVIWLRRVFASLFFVGYFPYGSGTVASALVVIGLWFAQPKIPILFGPEHFLNYWLAAIALTAVSFFISSKSKETFGVEDSPRIVIDEVVGQFITFLMIPITIKTLILGFVLFRFFDIVKPFPVHLMEDMEEGVGVTMDDVAAGVLANISLILLIALYNVIHGHL